MSKYCKECFLSTKFKLVKAKILMEIKT